LKNGLLQAIPPSARVLTDVGDQPVVSDPEDIVAFGRRELTAERIDIEDCSLLTY
jgi:hypothetical protein